MNTSIYYLLIPMKFYRIVWEARYHAIECHLFQVSNDELNEYWSHRLTNSSLQMESNFHNAVYCSNEEATSLLQSISHVDGGFLCPSCNVEHNNWIISSHLEHWWIATCNNADDCHQQPLGGLIIYPKTSHGASQILDRGENEPCMNVLYMNNHL